MARRWPISCASASIAEDGPILHVAGTDIAVDFEETLAPEGFTVNRVALYEAREAETLPAPARAAIEARDLDVVTFFSPRAAQIFARLVGDAGLADALDRITAVAISPAAASRSTGCRSGMSSRRRVRRGKPCWMRSTR